jgi:nicotinamide-nucleotide amidase
MTALILSIGDELALGQTVDTNSAWLSQQLAAVGCQVRAHVTVPDDKELIEKAIRTAIGRSTYLLISGGIGPTEDDLTRQALAAVMDVPLVINEVWLAKLEAFFKSRGREMPAINKIQAMIPSSATMIENTAGTAAGIYANFTYEDPPLLGVLMEAKVYVMPGVPKEMKLMFTRDVLPHIAKSTGGAVILLRSLHTFGLGESMVAEKLGELMDRKRNPSVGTTVANGIVSLRVNARFGSRDEAQKQLDETAQACRVALGDLIFGQDDQTLPWVVGHLLKKDRERPLAVATAESCTGGLLAKMITDVPGSSGYFAQGWVTYSNKAKYERLGVSMEVLNVYGAVSEPVVEAMAKAARRLAKSDFALSISGIAGPDGGSPTKPVGTVCIALAAVDAADRNKSILVQKRTFLFTGDREMIRDRSAKMALTMLRFHLLGKDLPF